MLMYFFNSISLGCVYAVPNMETEETDPGPVPWMLSIGWRQTDKQANSVNMTGGTRGAGSISHTEHTSGTLPLSLSRLTDFFAFFSSLLFPGDQTTT